MVALLPPGAGLTRICWLPETGGTQRPVSLSVACRTLESSAVSLHAPSAEAAWPEVALRRSHILRVTMHLPLSLAMRQERVFCAASWRPMAI